LSARRFSLHTFWCRKALKKNFCFGAKSRKQRVGNFSAS
jgi:hypothetical protein